MENNKLKEAMEEKGLKTKVFEALGEVSMCWSETPKGVFDSTKAKEIGDRLMEDIKQSHRDIITNTISSVGHQLFLQGIEMKKDYEILIGKETKPSLQEAIEVLCNALREDTSEGSYYYSWQANIAMAFQDEFQQTWKKNMGYSKDNDFFLMSNISTEILNKVSNEAAKNFLNLLISK